MGDPGRIFPLKLRNDQNFVWESDLRWILGIFSWGSNSGGFKLDTRTALINYLTERRVDNDVLDAERRCCQWHRDDFISVLPWIHEIVHFVKIKENSEKLKKNEAEDEGKRQSKCLAAERDHARRRFNQIDAILII